MDSDTSRSPEPEARIIDATPPGTRAETSTLPALRREVLYPQRQNTGVGVMLVASAAMFFAVASSAFILQAQMPMSEECPGASARSIQGPLVEVVEVELIELPAVDQEALAAMPCDEPVYQENDDGPSSIIFRLCDKDY